jgi:leucyl/phenylalanyl-tRNA--protein transferase
VSNNRVIWLGQNDPPASFPPVSEALVEPDGLLAAGGDLSKARLLYAYRHGIFPWYEDGQPILWWSPDPRCVFEPGDFHLARRLRRDLLKSDAEIRVNTAFGEVIRACAGPRKSEQGTWITTAIIAAFEQLHAAGWAHSIEVWQAGQLCGGLYGIAIGKVFFGESMFSATANASKMALLYLAQRMHAGDLQLLDCQLVSGHLQRLGARSMSRAAFVDRLESLCTPELPFRDWPDSAFKCSELVAN